MRSQPLFVIGAPRSGTTFLCHVLNQHPAIQLTNESRVFVLLKDLLAVRSNRPDLLDRDIRANFVHFVRGAAGDLVERFYREGLGVTAPIWGDKHPSYADPCVLSGRRGGEPVMPQSGSCLRLIRHCLPHAKFIHIHRNPAEVAHSLVRKGWTPSIESGLLVWRQYVTEAVEFFAELDPAAHLTIAHRDLIDTPAESAATLGRFLGLPDWEALRRCLEAQQSQPTPFSDPVSDLTRAYRTPPRRQAVAHMLAAAGQPARLFGYA